MNNHNTKNCRAHLKCTYCNGKGHTYDYCRRRRNATAGGQGRSKANHVAPQNHSKEDLPEFPFSREECHQLLSQLLANTKSASANLIGNIPNYEELSGKSHQFSQSATEITWILDSGASDHIVCSPTFLTSFKPVHNRWVKLPNGSSIPVTHTGTVAFSEHFVLHKVLCVPLFYLNLISMSKLAFDSFYITIFLRQVCFIQDLRSGKMIGRALRRRVFTTSIFHRQQRAMQYTSTQTTCGIKDLVTRKLKYLHYFRFLPIKHVFPEIAIFVL